MKKCQQVIRPQKGSISNTTKKIQLTVRRKLLKVSIILDTERPLCTKETFSNTRILKRSAQDLRFLRVLFAQTMFEIEAFERLSKLSTLILFSQNTAKFWYTNTTYQIPRYTLLLVHAGTCLVYAWYLLG